jgi:hypothetical protein
MCFAQNIFILICMQSQLCTNPSLPVSVVEGVVAARVVPGVALEAVDIISSWIKSFVIIKSFPMYAHIIRTCFPNNNIEAYFL